MKIEPYLKLFLTIVAVAAILIGWASWIDNRYAKEKNFISLKIKVSLNEARDALREALENMYFYRNQAKEHPEDEDIAQRLEEAEEEVEELKEHIKELKESQ